MQYQKIVLDAILKRIFFFKCYFSKSKVFMFYYFVPNFIEKFFWESGFSNFGQIKMTRNKNRLFCRHFETVQHFHFFFRIVNFYSPYIYGASFIAKLIIPVAKVVFYGWVPRNPPWAPTGVKVPCHLSVNINIFIFWCF